MHDVPDALVLEMQRDSLRGALVKVLDAREAEAKAYGSYQVALDNYGASHSQREGMRHTDAMVDASNAEREARVLLLTLRNAPVSRPQTEPLTDEQIMDLPAGVNDGSLSALLRFARAVERAHGIGA